MKKWRVLVAYRHDGPDWKLDRPLAWPEKDRGKKFQVIDRLEARNAYEAKQAAMLHARLADPKIGDRTDWSIVKAERLDRLGSEHYPNSIAFMLHARRWRHFPLDGYEKFEEGARTTP